MSARRRVPGRRLQPGAPAAPEAARLGLLPSGPDPVHGAPLRRTRPSSSTFPGAARKAFILGRGIRPRIRGFRVQGTPSAPLSTVNAIVPEREGLNVRAIRI